MVSSSERSRPPRAARMGSTSPIMSAMVTSGVASFSTKRFSRGIQEMRVSSPSAAIFSRQARQMGFRGSSLISQAEKNEIVAREQGIDDLRDYGVFIAVHAGEEGLALFDGAEQIAAEFILDGARSAAGIEIGNAL